MFSTPLNAKSRFSFGSYYDPQRNGFGPLVALNEDVIQPGMGFEMHPHKDMEIFIIPLSGAVEHRDSLGNRAFVNPGDVQKMTAGSGIWHSQMNASLSEVDHHLQVWLRPQTAGAKPAVEQRRFDTKQRIGQWQALVTPDGRDGSLSVDQDAMIHAATLLPGHVLPLPTSQSRSVYLHVIRGAIIADAPLTTPLLLNAGDALAMATAIPAQIGAMSPRAEVLVFELPAV
ncbi:pirin family protein (plasmid) [Pseudomonas sp. BYT-5]|uniref:pirin family protein n=1 Tax=unclassified Pseudomonas TaxID=196821 RepID=UPI0020227D28|nr:MULTISPECIES: pirin family protein [unclassified Pseudomonas]URD45506.1 pirin family protein [Pseudomonas sp. BYT-5]